MCILEFLVIVFSAAISLRIVWKYFGNYKWRKNAGIILELSDICTPGRSELLYFKIILKFNAQSFCSTKLVWAVRLQHHLISVTLTLFSFFTLIPCPHSVSLVLAMMLLLKVHRWLKAPNTSNWWRTVQREYFLLLDSLMNLGPWVFLC